MNLAPDSELAVDEIRRANEKAKLTVRTTMPTPANSRLISSTQKSMYSLAPFERKKEERSSAEMPRRMKKNI